MDNLFFFNDNSFENDNRIFTIPQCVSVSKNPDDDTEEQMITVHEKFLKLPGNIQDKLASDVTGEKVAEIGKKYDLSLPQMADIARAIRSYYFGELAVENIPTELAKEMGIDEKIAREISQLLIRNIIQDTSAEKEATANLMQLPLKEILKKYPEMGDQAISQESLALINSQEPARPTIKNWIMDYTLRFGYKNHTSIERGSFLFQSQNGRKISAEERNKLSQLIKSFDLDTPITVDPLAKKIIFQDESDIKNISIVSKDKK